MEVLIMEEKRITHQVIFCLKSGKDSPETARFLEDGKSILSSIPGTEKFKVMNQVSLKNNYDLGFSMEFANKEAYDKYNSHPLHIDFVKNRLENEVTTFLEIDFERY